MHHLFSRHYESWVQIPDESAKYFVRVWQDGLYTGTHPEWSFSPLSIQTLGKLWTFFKAPFTGPDYGRAQRKAIISIARRRITDLEQCEFSVPPQSLYENDWNEYFAISEAAASRYRSRLLLKLTTLLSDPDQATPYTSIEEISAEYAADSMRIGYTTRELYVRAGTGIIDPAGLKLSLPHPDRVAGLLKHLEQPTPKEFIVVTNLVAGGQMISNIFSKKLAEVRLTSPHDCKTGSYIALVNGRLVAITRCHATHSVSAFQLHRSQCKAVLRRRLSLIRRKNAELSESANVFLLNDPLGKGWKCELPKTALTDHFHKLEHSLDADAFVEAMESCEDEPEVAIRLLCDALDRLAGKNWPELCATIYTSHLQRELRRRMVIGIRVTKDRRLQMLQPPSWLQYVPEHEETIDFKRLAAEIRKDSIHRDELFAKRMDAVVSSTVNFSSQQDIRDLLELARGLRNSEVHSVPWPGHLMYVAVFLAKVLLVIFDLVSYETNCGDAKHVVGPERG
jgi:hypothetical protein